MLLVEKKKKAGRAKKARPGKKAASRKAKKKPSKKPAKQAKPKPKPKERGLMSRLFSRAQKEEAPPKILPREETQPEEIEVFKAEIEKGKKLGL